MKKSIITIGILALLLIILSTISIGASSTTFLYLDAIIIDNPNVEILSNEITIDTTTSKVENTIKLKNTSDNEISLDLAIPIENEELGISAKDVVIKLNDEQVEYVKESDGKYLVKSRISAKAGKKIDIEYNTENDLQKARIIKFNFDNLKGKKVGKLKVDIKIDNKNIPLVEKIYPGHYTFENNVISVEYYNYEVNTITKDVIVKKETFNNLLYGRETDLYDEEIDVIKEWYEKGNIDIDKNEFSQKYYNNNNEDGKPIKQINFVVDNIIDYSYIKNGKVISGWEEMSEPLLYEMYKVESRENDQFKRDLEGKNICIDFVETEDDKELYVNKVVDIQNPQNPEDAEPQIFNKLVKLDERTILQTRGQGTAYAGKRGAKIIFVGQGIDGESLNATEQEKISYINQINADMYIRIEIYDGTIQYKENEYGGKVRIGRGMVGYYDNRNSEIAKAFALCDWDELKTEEVFKNVYQYEYSQFYSNYEEYSKNYYNDYYNNCVIKLENEDITNKCEVPTVIQFIGNRIEKDGKYVVEYFNPEGFYDRVERGLITTNAALQTDQAKKMLSANKQKNRNTKLDAEAQISNFRATDDEVKIQKQIQDEIEELKRQEELKIKQAEEEKQRKENEEKTKNILVFVGIGLGIIACIVVIIVEHKKKKRREVK